VRAGLRRTVRPAASAVELGDQGEEAIRGGIDVAGEFGDLISEGSRVVDERCALTIVVGGFGSFHRTHLKQRLDVSGGRNCSANGFLLYIKSVSMTCAYS
jgi:hypothetical protein